MNGSTVSAGPLRPIPERLYEWFNSLPGRTASVTESELRDMWTEDCVMIANGELKCSGLPAFARHFNEIRSKLTSWRVQLPIDMRVAAEDHVAVYYHIDMVRTDGVAGKALVAAFFNVRDGKAASMTEIVHFEGAHLELQNH